ncbi:TorD/DmsD family molecular chaperone [Bacillus massiliigorillae]|uniref:TorD/DmsD family molecular chaperone n=1 Tax=Bacillus massiliigorillae TaxID=1243664 RepID=UPI0003A6B779|nr:molecular chaperone TorD family protein [Bacillus massiliigorillae]
MQATKESMKLEDVLNIFHARNFAYDILRRFFIEEPSKEYLKPFAYQNMIDLFPFQEESEGIKEGIQDIKNYLSSYDPVNKNEDYENLHWDFTKMFIGPFEIKVKPYESAYVSNDGLLFQGTTMAVRNLYKQFAFQSADHMEADDHIGLELDFMFHLNQLCIESCQQDNPNALPEIYYLLKQQQSFINNHLSKFVNEFTDGVIEQADTDFYKGLAKLLNHYLLIDLNVLNELLNIDLQNH